MKDLPFCSVCLVFAEGSQYLVLFRPCLRRHTDVMRRVHCDRGSEGRSPKRPTRRPLDPSDTSSLPRTSQNLHRRILTSPNDPCPHFVPVSFDPLVRTRGTTVSRTRPVPPVQGYGCSFDVDPPFLPTRVCPFFVAAQVTQRVSPLWVRVSYRSKIVFPTKGFWTMCSNAYDKLARLI